MLSWTQSLYKNYNENTLYGASKTQIVDLGTMKTMRRIWKRNKDHNLALRKMIKVIHINHQFNMT